MNDIFDSDIKSKKIAITGINNRYQIKKMIVERKEKTRSIICNIPKFFFEYNVQLEIINQWGDYPENSVNRKDFFKEIERKISGYKYQDILKKVFDESKIIQINQVIDMLSKCNLKCYYCESEIYILYEKVRDSKQWTLDRINNDLGHNSDNVLISCLECNLKRKNRTKDNFLFTKKLNIVKHENSIHICDSEIN